jgi:CubicO group peptidase (beta-lactamase class C family)
MRALVRAAGVLLIAAAGSAVAQDAVDTIVAEAMRARRIPGVAIAVVEDGRVSERAYGVANLETKTPLRTDAVFELASITKQFTAAAIMLLVEDGKVALDESVRTYVDAAPETWAGITVRQLLTHTAGLEIGAVPRIGDSAPLNVTTRAAFEFVSQQPPRFPPGREGWYSDGGYFLLGMVIEKASGESYRAFMQRRIFDRLGMTQSSILDKARVLEGRVPTYSLRDGAHVNWRRDWDYELPSFFGVFSTLQDLAKWDASLRAATLLDERSLAQMWTPATVAGGQRGYVLDEFYGFGFDLEDLRGRRTVGHGGASGTYMLRFLDEPLTIIVLTNLDAPSGSRHPVQLARAIAGAVRPELTPPEALEPSVDPSPELTAAVEALLGDIAADRAPALFSAAYARWWATAFGRRALLKTQLRGLNGLAYLGTDDVTALPLWDADTLTRLAHYRATVGERVQQITVGLTADGKIGRLEVPFQPSVP